MGSQAVQIVDMLQEQVHLHRVHHDRHRREAPILPKLQGVISSTLCRVRRFSVSKYRWSQAVKMLSDEEKISRSKGSSTSIKKSSNLSQKVLSDVKK